MLQSAKLKGQGSRQRHLQRVSILIHLTHVNVSDLRLEKQDEVAVHSDCLKRRWPAGNAAARQPDVGKLELVIKIDAAWLAITAEKLQGRLPLILDPLQSHPQPAVREALAAGNNLPARAIQLILRT